MYRAFQTDAPLRSTNVTVDELASPPSILGLPRIDAAVPSAYEGMDEPSIVMLARRLAQADVLTSADQSLTLPLADTLAAVLSREINAVAGNMQTFGIEFEFTPVDEYFENDPEKLIAINIGLIDDYRTIRLDKAIPCLNQVHPDLGQTLYAVMEEAGLATLQLHTYRSIRWRFEHELEPPDEWELAEDEDPEDFERYNFAEMESHFPFAWIAKPIPVLSPFRLARIGRRRGLDVNVREAIAAALDIAVFFEAGRYALGRFHESQPYQALVSIAFHEHDPTHALVDDIIHMAYENSDCYSPNLHEEHFDLSDLPKFENNWSQLLAGLRLLNALDRLVTALHKINERLRHD